MNNSQKKPKYQTPENALQALHNIVNDEGTRKEDQSRIEEFEQEIRDSLDHYYQDNEFYSLPLSVISSILSKTDFKSYHLPPEQMIETIIVNTTKSYPQNSALILHSINCDQIQLPVPECISILSCFQTCGLCVKLGKQFETDQTLSIDYSYELAMKTKEIEQMRNELRNSNRSIVKPDDFEPDIIKATIDGKLQSVQFIVKSLQKSNEIERNDLHGRKPLHIACLNGKLDIVQFLISQANANINSLTRDGYNALHCACKGGDLEIVQYLIRVCGANKEEKTQDYYQNTPLHIACKNGHLPIVQYLIEREGANPNETDAFFGMTCLHMASEFGHMHIVKYLVEKIKMNLDPKDKKQRTPLQIACEEENIEIIKYFLQKLNIDSPPSDFESNIRNAAEKGNLESIQYLIEKLGVDKDSRNIYGLTPLHIACKEGNLPIVQYLIEKQEADKEARTIDNYRYTPFHFACQNGHLDVAQYLIEEAHVKKDAKDGEGNTSLHLAAKAENVEMVKLLLAHGLNKHAKNKEEKKPSAMTHSMKIKFLL